MSHEKWDDNKIEQLLSNSPKIQDQRSKDDVFQRLKNDGLFDEMPSEKTKKRIQPKFKWMPIAVSIAAILLLTILIPSFMNQTHKNEEASTTMESAESQDVMNQADQANILRAEPNEEMGITSMAEDDLKSAVYPEDLEGNTAFTIGLASDDADSIPITILLPNNKVEEDLGKSNPTQVELYNYYAPKLDEAAAGFADYHPYKGNITESDGKVQHTLPKDHQYDMASATLTTYKASLIDTFPTYEEVEFLNEDGTPVIFSEEGVPSEPLKLNGESTQYNFYRYTQIDGKEYLAPNFRETFTSVEDALVGMKTETNDVYKSVILPEIDYSTMVTDGVVTVSFTAELDLLSFDQMDAMQMIEGMLLTAKSFNMQIQFENVKQTEWEGFDFTNPLPIPVGANELSNPVFQ
ncbi:type II secretory pathway pseudopilin PulG [Lysinibacillus composti]|uniref:hypothetical protein n=1 Tax=Lysinibacillus composti TaxID=720633 RepID=UPI0013153281|nr:hypothetical protein [Lysinibacillus composti]MBM7610444.1 type II secretory pathway pseudopilin PulG [Lysinibacillus composti]